MKTINYTGSSKLISRIVSLLNRKAPLPLDGDGDPDWGTNGQVLSTDGSGNTSWVNQGGGGSGGHTIEDTSGADLPQEDNLQFVGVYTEDDSANDRTKVNIVRQMTKAAMEALSSAEQEGFIDTTDEDDDYIPISAEDVKYGNTDVESKLDALTTDVSGKVSKSGDTMTSHLSIQRAGEAYVNVKNTNTGCIAYLDSDTNGDHGVWSNGYWNGSSYTASGQWILRRTTDGKAAIDVATVIGKNNATDVPLAVNRSGSGTVWISFRNGGSEIGAFGVSAAKKPIFWDTSQHQLLYKGDGASFSPTTFTNTSFTPTDNTRTTLYTNTSGHTQIVFCSVSAEIKSATGIIYLNKNNDGNNPLATAQLSAVDVTNPQYQHVTLTCFVSLANGDAIKYYPVTSGGTLASHSVVLAY